MVHVPFSSLNKTSDLRFSVKGEACFYFGATTYVCCQECKWNPHEHNLFISAFKPNESGKNLKILNFVLSLHLFNGFSFGRDNLSTLQKHILKIYPLVIATSFRIVRNNNGTNDTKYEYLLSQCLMKALKELGVDGIAYLSKQGSDDFQYPHGVNLALLVNDISEAKQYSDLCKCFNVTKPVEVNSLKNEDFEMASGQRRSYINAVYPRYIEGTEFEYFPSTIRLEGDRIFYGNTLFSKWDDYLVNQAFYEIEE